MLPDLLGNELSTAYLTYLKFQLEFKNQFPYIHLVEFHNNENVNLLCFVTQKRNNDAINKPRQHSLIVGVTS